MKSLQKEVQTKQKPYIYPVDINYYPWICVTDVM